MARKKGDFKGWLAEQLKDKEFRRAYEEELAALNVGIQIAKLRQERDLSQEELARRIGTHKQNIARLENPEYQGHTIRTLARIARAVGKELEVRFVEKRRAR